MFLILDLELLLLIHQQQPHLLLDMKVEISNQGFNPPLVVSPNESSFVGYSFYLPRIDKLVLTSRGDFF